MSNKVLVIDNYDSFTYNLVQLLSVLNAEVITYQSNDLTISDVDNLKVDKILISPGPGKPENAELSIQVVKKYGASIPILGVCLGHQVIGTAFGAEVVESELLRHGKTSTIKHDGTGIFKHMPQDFEAMRYHSLIIAPESLPDELEISAYSEDGAVMGIRHKIYPIEGIQFHPESILTKKGRLLLKNWLKQTP